MGRELDLGVFNPRTNVRGAEYTRERIHLIGFVIEKEFSPGEIGGAIRFVANPQLFDDAAAACAAIGTWPLQTASNSK
ncbi:MAG: hypothetical protein HQ514_21010 [Rhodospirillales bacterium]|nr:hypothetical protein [Rhodospirillales bacterium]